MKRQREKIPAGTVLAWLKEHHPLLFEDAMIDRAWVWITANLSGPEHKATRQAIKEYGFRWAKHGHPLPNGATGTWGHACTKPIPFKKGSRQNSAPHQPTEPANDEELMALLAETN